MAIRIVTDRLFGPGPMKGTFAVDVEGGRIASVSPWDGRGGEEGIFDLRGLLVSPGLVDIHTQGAEGASTFDGREEAIEAMSEALAKRGVTSFMATTFAVEEMVRAAARAARKRLPGARCLGVYLETPFVNPKRRGGILERFIEPPDLSRLKQILEWAEGMLRFCVVAPELPGAMEVIRALVQCGVKPTLGHTDATYEEAVRGFEAGIRHVTHLFNAMRGFHHRDPGPAVAALERPDVTVEIICDGVHLHPATVRLAVKAAGPGRVALITDASRAAGMPDGVYEYGGKKVVVKGKECRAEDGTLSGSVIFLNEAVRNVQKFAGVSLGEALVMATLTPARAAGVDNSAGRIAPGYRADIAAFDDGMRCRFCMVGGRVILCEA